MYLKSLTIQNLRRIRFLHLDFTLDGEHRAWTVIIGENGTAKTSILQAIALISTGSHEVNSLAEPVARHLRDRRSSVRKHDDTEGVPHDSLVVGGFEVKIPAKEKGFSGVQALALASTIWMFPGENSLRSQSQFLQRQSSKEDPLREARFEGRPFWFVAGYGVARSLPNAGTVPKLDNPHLDRLRSLFGSDVPLSGTAFANYFEGDMADAYHDALRKVLLEAEGLLPEIEDIGLKGKGGVQTAGDLQERHWVLQAIGKEKVKLPTVALSHGYQATLSWIADLIGHLLLDAGKPLKPEEMAGLVLVDEIDLYLHPRWQVTLIPALRKVFPGLQFIVTTHSPLVVAGLRPETDAVIRLRASPETGDIEQVPVNEDPRLLTGTELYRRYFGIEDIYPDQAGRDLRDYRYLAANPFRLDDDEVRMKTLRKRLAVAGINPGMEPVPREQIEATPEPALEQPKKPAAKSAKKSLPRPSRKPAPKSSRKPASRPRSGKKQA